MARLLVEAVDASDPVPRRVILATELVQRASSAGRRIALEPAGDRRTLERAGSAPTPIGPKEVGDRSAIAEEE